MSGPPVHLVPDAPGHGVALYAAQVAGAVGAAVVDLAGAASLPPQRLHVHVTDRLFGRTCEEAADRLTSLAQRHRTTVTLHDVPQPGDGAAFERRARAYAAVLEAAHGWVVSSEHERALVERHVDPSTAGAVVHLPVMPLPGVAATTAGPAEPTGPAVVGVLGWVYPGKGHAEVLAACARLERPVTVRAVGRPAVGHEALVDELAACASALDVGWEVTGWVPDADLATELAAVDVAVAAHGHVSASGSVNSWIAAGRRPLVVTGSYAAEMDRLRPGTLALVDPAPAALAAALTTALGDPATTWLAPGVATAPGLPEVAAAYLDWWAAR